MKTHSEIELSQTLTKLSRQITRLKAGIPTNLSAPKDYVEKVRVEGEIAVITKQQNDICIELLKREKTADERKSVRLEATRLLGAKKAAELLDRLSTLADKIAIAFKVLGDEHKELLQLSAEIRHVNMGLLNANLPQCINASIKIEPNSLHKLLKEQFKSCFGANTADVFLPKQNLNYDIIKDVESIKQTCTSDK
jgi:hypothetical protein